MNVYPFIEAEKAEQDGNVAMACVLLEVSRSAYYERRNGPPSQRAVTEAQLLEKIIAIFKESKGTYGAPRIHKELLHRHLGCGKRRVTRLMRQAGLEGRCKKRWRRTTIPDPEAKRARDLIQRHFGPSEEMDRRYVGHITYIATWRAGPTWRRHRPGQPPGGGLGIGRSHAHRTGRGRQRKHSTSFYNPHDRLVLRPLLEPKQYTSRDFAELARANGVVLSVGRKGECWDNAVAESFFATIKRELIDARPWPTRIGLRRAVFEYIEGWYNTRRLHSTLGTSVPLNTKQSTTTPTIRRHNQHKQAVRRAGSSPALTLSVIEQVFVRVRLCCLRPNDSGSASLRGTYPVTRLHRLYSAYEQLLGGAMRLSEREAEFGSSQRDLDVGRREWAIPALLVGCAFGFRIVLGYIFTQYGGDAPGYTIIGRNLAAGRGYSVAIHAPYLATDIRLPGYPAILALAFSVSDSHWVVIILNALLGAASTLLVWYIARGLNLTRAVSLWSMGIAAFCFATASFAGIALSENLSVPAVLAFVYVVLIKPPRNPILLIILGSLLAWVMASTRDELVIFVVVVAIVAARRAGLRAFGAAILVFCFLVGPGAWVVRNQIQVHRTELVDSLMSDSVVIATLNGQNFSDPLYVRSQDMAFNPRTTQAQRTQFHERVYTYAKHMLLDEPGIVAERQATDYVEAFFPVPIFGATYTSSLLFFERCIWSIVVLAEYGLALFLAFKWWRAGRRKDVVSIGLFPAFMAIFMLFIDPQPRFWLPSILLLLPAGVAGAAALDVRELIAKLIGTSSDPNVPVHGPDSSVRVNAKELD